MSDFSGPLFIVGLPRSGTKLLRELLNRHPRVGIPDVETEFLPWLAHCLPRFGDVSDRVRFARLYRRLAAQSFFAYRRQASRDISAEVWYGACRRFDAAGLFEALIRLDVDAAPGSSRIWGDKSPSYVDDLPLIDRIFPQARVLHIVRDVRDYCVSVNHAWGKDMRRAAYRWAQGVTAARRDGVALGERYAEVRYEDLLCDPESVMRKACGFLGIDFRAEMLTLARPSENLGRARGVRHVVADNFGNFRTRMDAMTLSDVEQVAADAMREFGYEPALPAPPRTLWLPVRLRLAQLHDAWAVVRRRAESHGVLEALMFHVRYFVMTRG